MKLINQLKDLDVKEFKEIYLDMLKTEICPERHSELKFGLWSLLISINVIVSLGPSSTMLLGSSTRPPLHPSW